MRTPLAWLNLVYNKPRTLLAIAGVAFAVVLIFMQLGFLGSARTSATMVHDALAFDVLIRSPNYIDLLKPSSFSRERLYRVASVPEVQQVSPFYVSTAFWRNPKTGRKRTILLMGARPADNVFRSPELQKKSKRLSMPEFVLIDRKSHRDFGPKEGNVFSDADIGVQTEVGGKSVQIVGHFELGTGFAADGAILLSDEGLARVAPGQTIEDVTFGLVTLKPGADPEAVAARLQQLLGEEVEVLSREAAYRSEVKHWVQDTPVGVIFQLGVGIALVVGTAIVYQVLSSDVANHMAEYATLKAIGYGSGFLSRVVLQQAVILAVLGFLPGLAVAEIFYEITAHYANLPIGMTTTRIVFVLGLSVAMCVVSGLGALRKVLTADPADLF